MQEFCIFAEMADDKINIDFRDISRKLKEFSFPEMDYVVGIATGGIYAALLIAHQLNLPCRMIHITFRDPDNKPLHKEPVILSGPIEDLPEGSRVLLVDEVSVSGKTMGKALELLKNYQVKTFVLKGRGDLVLYPDVKTCVNWPWKI